jgi:hypothetical protein
VRTADVWLKNTYGALKIVSVVSNWITINKKEKEVGGDANMYGGSSFSLGVQYRTGPLLCHVFKL